MAAAPYQAYGDGAGRHAWWRLRLIRPTAMVQGDMPDGGCALSGLRRWCRATCLMAAAPYQAYGDGAGWNAWWRLCLIRPTGVM